MITIKIVAVQFFCLLLIQSFSQNLTIKSDEARIKGHKVPGHAVELDGTEDEIAEVLQRRLKGLGKVKRDLNTFALTQSSINGDKPEVPIYFVAKNNGTVWGGILSDDWGAEFDSKNNQVRQFVREFGVYYYQNKAQLEIDETNQAIKAVDKQKSKLVTEREILNQKIEYNQKERARLLKSLEETKQDSISLQLRLRTNQQAQDSVKVVGDQIQKVLLEQTKRKEAIN